MFSTAEKLARVRSFASAFNSHDPAACATHFAEDSTIVTTAGLRVQGRQAVEELYRRQFAAFPDIRIEILKATVAKEQVFAEYRLEGTHLGPLSLGDKEHAPTGRNFKVQYLAIAAISPVGELTQLIQTGDAFGMLRQLQIAPPPHMNDEKIAGVVENMVAALNHKDLDALATCFSPNAVFGSETLGRVQGREAIREMFAHSFTAYPNNEFRTTSLTIQDNTAVVGLTSQGTQSGSLPWREGTNREVAIEMTLVAEVGPMGIIGCRQYYDSVKLMKQLGFLPV